MEHDVVIDREPRAPLAMQADGRGRTRTVLVHGVFMDSGLWRETTPGIDGEILPVDCLATAPASPWLPTVAPGGHASPMESPGDVVEAIRSVWLAVLAHASR